MAWLWDRRMELSRVLRAGAVHLEQVRGQVSRESWECGRKGCWRRLGVRAWCKSGDDFWKLVRFSVLGVC